jgi:hypothetical protein
VAALLEHFHDLVFVLGEDLREAVCLLDEVVLRGAAQAAVDELVGIINFGAEREHLAGFLGDGDSVASEHFDAEPKDLRFGDGGRGIFAGRVEHREHTEELPRLGAFFDGDTEGAEAAAGELGGFGFVLGGGFGGALGEGEDGFGSTFGAGVADAVFDADGRDAFGDGVKGGECLSGPAGLEAFFGFRVALEGEHRHFVDGVEGFDVVRGGEGSDFHHPVYVNAFSDEGLADAELVGGESTGFVGAENIDTLLSLDVIS